MRTLLIIFLSAFLCSARTEAQISNTIEADSVKLPVWKQIRQRYGLPITRQTHRTFFGGLKHFWDQKRKGHLGLLLSLPYINWYNLSPEGTSKRDNGMGFIGIGGGLEYFHTQKNSLSLKWNGTMTFPVPFPAPVDDESNHTHIQGMDLSLIHNHYIKYLSIGYGVCIARNSWNYHTSGYDDKTEPSGCDFGDVDLSSEMYAIGTPFHFYGYFSKSFGVGLNYRPTFYRIGSSKPWKYEHLISIDFQFRIFLKK